MSVCVCVGLETLRLIFADKMLDGNELLLCDFGIQQHSIIQMVMRVPGGGGPCPRCGHVHEGGICEKGGINRSMEKLHLF